MSMPDLIEALRQIAEPFHAGNTSTGMKSSEDLINEILRMKSIAARALRKSGTKH